MTLERGWKARRDAAKQKSESEKKRTDIRRDRARILENVQPSDDNEGFQTTEMAESRRDESEDWSGENSKNKTENFPEDQKTFNKTAEDTHTADLTESDENNSEGKFGNNYNDKTPNVAEEDKTFNETAKRPVTDADVAKAEKDDTEDRSGENSKEKTPNVAEEKKTFNKTAEEPTANPEAAPKSKGKKEKPPVLVDDQYLVEE